MARFALVLLGLCLAGCASYGGAGLRPGEARMADVEALMGAPAMRWQDADGAVQLAYPRGPLGYHTFMVHLGADGRLQRIENVLDEATFARIGAGMSRDQVLRLIGPPDFSRTMYFPARDELVWDWRFCPYSRSAARFSVLFDAASGTVRSTLALVEYVGRAGTQIQCAR